MQKILFTVLIAFLFVGCSCSRSRETLRVGVDSAWYPLNFRDQTSYINGFTDEVLFEAAQYSRIDIEKIPANWDTLFEGLKEKKYDAILTSLPPYEYNKAKFDFSSSFLSLGPVLVVSKKSPKVTLEKLNGKVVGIVAGDPSVLLLEKKPEILIRTYDTIPDLLNALVADQIDAALLDRIPAVNFVSDLYAQQLKIGSEPLTDQGLRLVSRKESNVKVSRLNKALTHLLKEQKFTALLKKWQL